MNKEKKVWIVSAGEYSEGAYIVGVFTTYKRALAHVTDLAEAEGFTLTSTKPDGKAIWYDNAEVDYLLLAPYVLNSPIKF